MTTSTSTSFSNIEAPEAVDLLYTNIGRGHPFYLDGIARSLPPASRGEISDVFSLTTGLANWIWHAGRAAYRLGSSAGGRDSLYTRLRKAGDYNSPGMLLRWAGTPLRRRFAKTTGPLIVAHPILVALLRSHHRLVYQHGELIVPPECLVSGHHIVLVPTQQTADVFIRAGHPHQNLIVTGLCIEQELAAGGTAAFAARQRRYTETEMLTGGFFSSGAEPHAHIGVLTAAAMSAVVRGGSALIVAHHGGAYANSVTRAFARRGLTLATNAPTIPPSGALLQTYHDRGDLDRITHTHFDALDYFVSPSHERTNWAVGLGLPMFIVDPPIGTYAPRNRELLLKQGVAETLATIQEASALGASLERLRKTGTLAKRSESGWGHDPIDGFRTIVDWLSVVEGSQRVLST
ncbi:MAG: hypothetical protein HN341_17440 [Verrucomicrobia bacterium]|nr:hypothetical protein [Verrucomicrobiota bacterium]